MNLIKKKKKLAMWVRVLFHVEVSFQTTSTADTSKMATFCWETTVCRYFHHMCPEINPRYIAVLHIPSEKIKTHLTNSKILILVM